MRYLGIDYGKKRVGIALSDEGLEFALPKAIFPNDSQLVKKVKEFCGENDVSLIVIGESKNYKGEENPIMKDVHAFSLDIKGVTGLPVVLEPEFMTSAEAERVQFRRTDRDMDRTGVKPNRKEVKNEMLDASAAALILKSYLEKEKNI